LYEEMAVPITTSHPSMHTNSFFAAAAAAAAAAVTGPNGALLSTQYAISPLSYHGQEESED
jgi:hypothetical protein